MRSSEYRGAWWAAVLVAAALTGCAMPNPPGSLVMAEDPATTTSSPTVDKDSTPASSPWGALVGNAALDDWIRKAVARHPALKTARAGTEVARSRVRAARAARRPALDVQLDARAGEHGGTAVSSGGNLEPAAFKVEGSWELDPFGRIRAAVGAARYAQVAADYERRDLELAIAAEIAAEYVAALLQFERLAIRKSIVAARAEIERYHRNRLDAGLTKREMRERSTARRLEAERAQLETAKELAVLAENWKALVPTNSVPTIPSIERVPLPPIPDVPKQDRLHVYAVNRPDVTAANADRRSADRRSAAAARGRLPTMAAVVSAEGTGPSPVDEPDEWMAWAGVRVTLPVLAPGTAAGTDVGRAAADHAAAQLDDAVRLALLDVRRAYAQRVHAEREWQAARARAAELKAALASVERQRERGLLSVPEVAEARLAWLAADEKARMLHARTLQHHISLVRACGGPGI